MAQSMSLVYRFHVDGDIGEGHLRHIRDGIGRIGNTTECTVRHIHIANPIAGDSIEIQHLSSACYCEIIEVEGTSEVGREATCLAVIMHGNKDNSMTEVSST